MNGQFLQRTFKRQPESGVSLTLTEQGAYESLFLVANSLDSDEKPLSETLERVTRVLEDEGFRGRVIVLNVFFDGQIDRDESMRCIRGYFGRKTAPATTLIFQPPLEGKIALELTAIRYTGEEENGAVKLSFSPENRVLLETKWFSLLNVGGLYPGFEPIGAYKRSLSTFEKMRNGLENSGMKVEQILRTWIYQGHLTMAEGQTQRYKELNGARTDFFEGKDFIPDFLPTDYSGPKVYPASTGIGDSGYDVTMSCVALGVPSERPRGEVRAVPLENPLQTSAFDYAEKYSPQSPKFSRAMLFTIGRSCTVFVSGTASITSQETQHLDDPIGQTRQTLDNIEALIAGTNLARHGIPGFEAGLGDLAVMRVYIKRREDYGAIRKLCEERCPDVPCVYTVADVCRDDLLVEIEGIVLARSLFR